jgi:hypothetical protein
VTSGPAQRCLPAAADQVRRFADGQAVGVDAEIAEAGVVEGQLFARDVRPVLESLTQSRSQDARR